LLYLYDAYNKLALVKRGGKHVARDTDGLIVVVNSQGVFVGTQSSDVSKFITATSGVGLSGTIEINSPDNSSIQNSFTKLSLVAWHS
ncbi:MAG: hypothetical protein ACYTXI_06100, partial [Nostoc sp.]